MKYRKPEIVPLANAIDEIQAMDKIGGAHDLVQPQNPFPSTAAYQSDE